MADPLKNWDREIELFSSYNFLLGGPIPSGAIKIKVPVLVRRPDESVAHFAL